MSDTQEYINLYLNEVVEIVEKIDRFEIEKMIEELISLRERRGRLFILGVGGSAGNASHAVNDFRKIGGIEAYAPTDNVSELTARINDEGWDSSLVETLRVSNFNSSDALLVLSVGGGSETTSQNLVQAMKYAKVENGQIFAMVSRNGGTAANLADVCIMVPVVNENHITPHAEEWQAVLWHMIVNHLGSAASRENSL